MEGDDHENKQDSDGSQEDFPMDECMKNNKQKYTAEDFKRIHVIGRGSYGKVYLVRKILQQKSETTEEVTGDLYAMKVLK